MTARPPRYPSLRRECIEAVEDQKGKTPRQRQGKQFAYVTVRADLILDLYDRLDQLEESLGFDQLDAWAEQSEGGT